MAVFIDDAHHESDDTRARNAELDRRLEDLGYIVVRFFSEPESWPAVFAANADLFGLPSNKD